MNDSEDKELSAMQSVFSSLSGLDDQDSQQRVIAWVSDRLGLKATKTPSANAGDKGAPVDEYTTFADLFNAASPKTNADRALVAGYWLQDNEGQEQFGSQTVNKLLQDLGYPIANVTDAFSQLYNKTPRLALQVRKSGKSKQARKSYKLTQAGIDSVIARTRGNLG